MNWCNGGWRDIALRDVVTRMHVGVSGVGRCDGHFGVTEIVDKVRGSQFNTLIHVAVEQDVRRRHDTFEFWHVDPPSFESERVTISDHDAFETTAVDFVACDVIGVLHDGTVRTEGAQAFEIKLFTETFLIWRLIVQGGRW